MGFRVLDVQQTPNPNAMKFILDRPCTDQTLSFLKPEQATGHTLAERLFAVRGVSSLMLLGDFITVNKTASASWSRIRPAVEAALAGPTEE